MKRRNHPKSTLAPDRAPISWLYVFVTLVCACLLATGFFYAARQHFTAMDLGIKNSKLRKQVADMESEKRRLLLSREVVRSPGEVKRTAMKHGLRDAGELFAPVPAAVEQPKGPSLVARTALSAPTAEAVSGTKQVKAFYPAKEAKPVQTVKVPGAAEQPKAKRVSNELVATVKVRK